MLPLSKGQKVGQYIGSAIAFHSSSATAPIEVLEWAFLRLDRRACDRTHLNVITALASIASWLSLAEALTAR